jgi:hypothetical protein
MDPLDDAFFSKSSTARLRLSRAPATLHPGHGATPPTLTSPPDTEIDTRQAHGNGRQNGRAWTTLPAGRWRERWRQPLAAGPRLLTYAGERIVVAGSGRWALFAVADGASLAGGPMGGVVLAIDAGAGRFVFPSSEGLLEARALGDGAQQFSGGLTFGRGYARTFLTATGSRAWIAGIEIVPPRLPRKPTSGVIEVRAWHEPPRVNLDGITDARAEALLHRDEVPLIVAGTGATLVAATARRLYWLDRALQPQDVVEGDFAPTHLSLDEADRAYVLSARRLLVATRDGGLAYEAALPDDMAPIAPALVSPAHEVFIVGTRRVLAFDASGRVRWSRMLGGAAGASGDAAGALVDAHGRLLVADGRELVAFGDDGARVLLADVGAPLAAAPLLLANGDIVAATATHLVAWTTQK